MERKCVYFVSDLHFGFDGKIASLNREQIFVNWLDQIKNDCKAIYIVGDLFDYWFEYKQVVPKGYFRLFSALSKLVDDGIEVHFIKGNHDMWVGSYFSQHLGIKIYDNFAQVTINNKRFYVTHGDGLSTGFSVYKLTKWIFRNPFCQKIFSFIHPTVGLWIMKTYSSISRNNGNEIAGNSKLDGQIQFCERKLQDSFYDFFVMGHFHYPYQITLSNGISRYFNLGDWVEQFTYGVWDGEQFDIRNLKDSEVKREAINLTLPS